MALAPKRNYINATSFKGTFVFPKLNEVDYGSKDYPVPDGQYVVRLKGNRADPSVAAWISRMEAEMAKAEEAAKVAFGKLKVDQRQKLKSDNGPSGVKANPLFKIIYDEETEEPTGEIEVKFQLPHKVTTKSGPRKGQVKYNKPIIVDARGIAIPANKMPKIGGGSTGIISYDFPEGGYFVEGSGRFGVKLRMVAVQLLSVQTYGERTAASLGFTAQEGITSDDLEEVTTDTDTEENNDTDGVAPETNEDF